MGKAPDPLRCIEHRAHLLVGAGDAAFHQRRELARERHHLPAE